MVAKDGPAGEERRQPAAEPQVGADAIDTEASQEVMRLLGEHVPLALLADLAIPSGPESPQILEDEGLPSVAWWEGKEDAAPSAEDEPVTP